MNATPTILSVDILHDAVAPFTYLEHRCKRFLEAYEVDYAYGFLRRDREEEEGDDHDDEKKADDVPRTLNTLLAFVKTQLPSLCLTNGDVLWRKAEALPKLRWSELTTMKRKERAFLALGLLDSAFRAMRMKTPPVILESLIFTARELDLPPILTYDAAILSNFRIQDTSSSLLEIGNAVPILPLGMDSPDWRLSLGGAVAVEAAGAPAVRSAIRARILAKEFAAYHPDVADRSLIDELHTLARCISRIESTMRTAFLETVFERRRAKRRSMKLTGNDDDEGTTSLDGRFPPVVNGVFASGVVSYQQQYRRQRRRRSIAWADTHEGSTTNLVSGNHALRDDGGNGSSSSHATNHHHPPPRSTENGANGNDDATERAGEVDEGNANEEEEEEETLDDVAKTMKGYEFFTRVRTYFAGTRELFGGSAAQSPLFALLDAILGVDASSNPDTSSGRFLLECRRYMRPAHRQMLNDLDAEPRYVRDWVMACRREPHLCYQHHASSAASNAKEEAAKRAAETVEAYDECIDRYIELRRTHLFVTKKFISTPSKVGGAAASTSSSLEPDVSSPGLDGTTLLDLSRMTTTTTTTGNKSKGTSGLEVMSVLLPAIKRTRAARILPRKKEE